MQTGDSVGNEAKGRCEHIPSAFHGALLRWPISIILLLFLEQRQFFWIHYLCCCSHHWCVLLSQIHSLSRLFSSSSESYSKNRDCFADGRKEVFSKCIVLFFFLSSQACSKLFCLTDCCTPCHESECSSKAPHWPGCFVSLFWVPIIRNRCSSVWALNKKPELQGHTEIPVNLCLISVTRSYTRQSWCYFSYS